MENIRNVTEFVNYNSTDNTLYTNDSNISTPATRTRTELDYNLTLFVEHGEFHHTTQSHVNVSIGYDTTLTHSMDSRNSVTTTSASETTIFQQSLRPTSGSNIFIIANLTDSEPFHGLALSDWASLFLFILVIIVCLFLLFLCVAANMCENTPCHSGYMVLETADRTIHPYDGIYKSMIEYDEDRDGECDNSFVGISMPVLQDNTRI